MTLRCYQPDLGGYSFQLSHELIEMASDPIPDVNPSFIFVDPPLGPNGENADLCYPLAVNETATLSGQSQPVSLARFWSNAAVIGATDPCVPAPPVPYFGIGLSDSP